MAAGAVPPTGLVFVAILSVQLGATIAKGLFPSIGPGGAVFLRLFIGALALLLVQRPRWRGHSRHDYLGAALLGLAIAGMNSFFYAALARLPLGIAVTLEFVGPLSVAVTGSRRRLDVLWGALAAAGILLLAPTGHFSIDPVGVAFALLAGLGWAAYILLNVSVGRAFPGATGLAFAMAVAGLVVLPFGLQAAPSLLADPKLVAAGGGVALLSSFIPFSLEHAALKRLPARAFGVLMSWEPTVAALVGFIVLRESLGLRGLLALVSVTIATAGSARFGGPQPPVRGGTPPLSPPG